MIDPGDGKHLVCMWDDCQRHGDTRHQVVIREPFHVPTDLIVVKQPHQDKRPRTRNVIYLFCSERHKMLHVNSHRDNGNLPTGWKGTLL